MPAYKDFNRVYNVVHYRDSLFMRFFLRNAVRHENYVASDVNPGVENIRVELGIPEGWHIFYYSLRV
jgi:hypothetical protein